MGNSFRYYQPPYTTATIPPLPNRIRTIDCSDTRVTVLPNPLPPSLQTLSCDRSQISQIPPLPSSLTTLSCSSLTRLQELPALPPGLRTLNCISTALLHLPPLPATLEYLDCARCHELLSLPPLPESLRVLDCHSTPLRDLPPLPDSLETLICSFTQLTALSSLPSHLRELDISSTEIQRLPPLPAGLSVFKCSHSLLTELPEIPQYIFELECHHMVRFPVTFQISWDYWRRGPSIRDYADRWDAWREEQRKKRLAKAHATAFEQGILEPAFTHRRIRQRVVRTLRDELGRTPTAAEIDTFEAERPMSVEFFQLALLEFESFTTVAFSKPLSHVAQTYRGATAPSSLTAALPELADAATYRRLLRDTIAYERHLYDMREPVFPPFSFNKSVSNFQHGTYLQNFDKFQDTYCAMLQDLEKEM